MTPASQQARRRLMYEAAYNAAFDAMEDASQIQTQRAQLEDLYRQGFDLDLDELEEYSTLPHDQFLRQVERIKKYRKVGRARAYVPKPGELSQDELMSAARWAVGRKRVLDQKALAEWKAAGKPKQ